MHMANPNARMYSSCRFFCLISSAFLLLGNTALATPLNINGFLSSSITKTNHSTPYLEAKEYTDNINYQSGTVMGLMLSKRLDSRVNFQGQLTARGSQADKSLNYKPGFDMPFLDYKLRPSVSIKVGKFIADNYLISKHLDVGASYLWARPPVEVYETSYSFLTNINGVELTYQKKLGMFNLRLQPYIGRMSENLISRTSRSLAFLDSESIYGAGLSIESQSVAIHLSSMHADSVMRESDGTLVIMPDTRLYSFGAKANFKAWLVQAEVAHVDVGPATIDFTTSMIPEVAAWPALKTDIPSQTGYYLTVARELGSTTPYLTLASTNTELKANSDPGISKGFMQEQESLTVGARYYATNSLTLKFEYHQADILNDTTGLFIQLPTKGDDLQLWTISFNILF